MAGEKNTINYNIKQKLSGISGTLLPVIGEISNASLNIGEKSVKTTLVAVQGLAEDLILGTEFLDYYDMVIDFANKRLFNSSLNVPLRTDKKLDRNLFVHNSEEVCVEPGFKTITAQIFKNLIPEKEITGLFIIEPNKDLWGEQEKDDRKWVIEVTKGQCNIPIFNEMENASFIIPAQTVIAEITPIIYNVNEVQEKTENRFETILKLTKIRENPHLNKKQIKIVEDILKEFEDVFAITRDELSLCTEVEHEIPLIDTTPVQCPYRRVPFHLFKDLEKEVQSLLDANIIEYSDSEYSSPAILLKNKSGKQRLIVDYRVLNKRSSRSWSAVPSVNTLTAKWKGKEFFCSLDFKDSYYQIPIRADHRYLTAFTIPSIGHFQAKKLMMGLKGAPSTFQALLDKLLTGIKDSCLNFIDDLIVASITFEEMCSLLKEVFTRLRQSSLKLNPKKCDLFMTNIKFLGMILSRDGISVDPEKTEAVRNMPIPKTKKQCQRFLGAASWFRNHIKDFAKNAKGLTDTLRGEKFIMTEEAIKSVQELKNMMCNPPVLIYPDLNKEMHLYTDASMEALGAVIGQEINGKFHPIAYGSKTLSTCQSAYPSFKKEFLALKHFIEHWRFYLLHGRFKAFVDMEAIVGDKFLSKTTSITLLRWILALCDYDFVLEHKSGSKMQLPDMLSRPPPKGSEDLFDWYINNSGHKGQDIKKQDFNDPDEIIASVSIEQALNLRSPREGSFNNPIKAKRDSQKTWLSSQKEDVLLEEVRNWVINKSKPNRRTASTFDLCQRKLWNQFDRLVINEDNILCYKYFCKTSQKFKLLILVPRKKALEVINAHHSLESAGHMGFVSTLANIRKTYYWPKMSTEVKLFCANCQICFLHNQKYQRKPKAPLKQFPVFRPGVSIALDLIGPFTKQKTKFKWILTIVDRYSKYCEAAAMKTAESVEIAKCLKEKWLFRYGMPSSILSDNAKNLHHAKIMQELYDLLGCQKNRTTSYHPRTNGQVERKQKDLVVVLKKLVGENRGDWPDKLLIATFALNQAVSSTTKFSPNDLMFTYEVRNCSDLIFDTTSTEVYASQEHFKMDTYYYYRDVFDLVRKNITDSLKLQKRIYDRQTNYTPYEEGDKVLLYKPIPPKIKDNRKLHNVFTGPHIILKCISEHNFLIESCEDKKQQVVHYDALRLMKRGKLNKKEETILPSIEPTNDVVDNGPTGPLPEEQEEEDQDDDERETIVLNPELPTVAPTDDSANDQDNQGEGMIEQSQEMADENEKWLEQVAEEDRDENQEVPIPDSITVENISGSDVNISDKQDSPEPDSPTDHQHSEPHDDDAPTSESSQEEIESKTTSTEADTSNQEQSSTSDQSEETDDEKEDDKDDSSSDEPQDDLRRSRRPKRPPPRFADEYGQLYGRK